MFRYTKILMMIFLFANLNHSKSNLDITLFLCGDVMTGRGIDQILPSPSNPVLYESFIKDAREYVKIAERKNGKIKKPVSYNYIWGDALKELEKRNPDIKLINLETSITKKEDYWKRKGINYRMHPENIHAISSAGINCCMLANNHTLDWEYDGFNETLETLNKAKINYVGAGNNLQEASAPVIFNIANTRVLVFGVGMTTSGIPFSWRAAKDKPGLNVFSDYFKGTIESIKKQIDKYRLPNNIVVLSLHWEGNWGYDISDEETEFVHNLIDLCGVDVVHGHSSHHAKALEVYKNKLILYGSGDFINDYEGISGYEAFRDDLSFMYFLNLDAKSGDLKSLELVPMRMKKFQVINASEKERKWLFDMINRECTTFNISFNQTEYETFLLQF